MCGITGYLGGKIEESILKKMMDRIAHRGPDGQGMYLDEYIALGHRRLAIIDLDNGIQPMKNESGNLICIFNGEIYNYQELREQLCTCGHRFRTRSDTEVLLHGYEQWGQELPKKLRGMFAFVIWECREKRLFCARDYFGIKPFYYYHKNHTFLFSSEIKSFLAHPAFEKRLNQKQLELYLSYQYSPGEETFFINVYKLPPAHFMIWEAGDLKIERYWSGEFETDETKTEDEWVKNIQRVLSDSVAAHKISHVEVGSFLSSGVDSSYIAALAKVDKTFSVGYTDEKYDESTLAGEFSKRISTQHTTCQITPEEFWNHLPSIQYQMDEPLADASACALYFLNREAAKQVKVCLSGEGADELFAGYGIYQEPFYCALYEQIPEPIRRGIGSLAEYLPKRRGINFLIRNKYPLQKRYIGNTLIFTEKEKRKLLYGYQEGNAAVELARSYFQHPNDGDLVTRMQYTDMHLWLVGDILLKADKMSMAHGLELRVPFLDKQVFQMASHLPECLRVNRKQTKVLLRRAAETTVGKACAYREKRGFPVPVREWIKEEPYASYIRSAFTSPEAELFFKTEYLTRLLSEHTSGKQDNWRKIWCVYMFLLWYQEYFQN